jgi:hypothetical protein
MVTHKNLCLKWDKTVLTLRNDQHAHKRTHRERNAPTISGKEIWLEHKLRRKGNAHFMLQHFLGMFRDFPRQATASERKCHNYYTMGVN